MPIVRTLKNGQWVPCTTIDNLPLATQLSHGLMSSADKSKLDKMSNYSTDEQVIGTWIDGKPIYRKCYTGTASSTGGTLLDNDLNINTIIIVGYGGSIYQTNDEYAMSIGGYLNENWKSCVYLTSDLEIRHATNLKGHYYVWVEYIKITD